MLLLLVLSASSAQGRGGVDVVELGFEGGYADSGCESERGVYDGVSLSEYMLGAARV